MKTKLFLRLSKLLLAGSVFLLLSGFTFYQNNQVDDPNCDDREVILQGLLDNGKLKSLASSLQQNILVTIEDQSIAIAFLQNLGSITIEITDEVGQPVYINAVNSIAGGNLIIDISGWTKGSYRITFSNSSGSSMSSEFDIY